MKKIDEFRLNLQNNKKISIGFWSQYFNYFSIKTICDLDYQWICLDMEHGVYDFEDIAILTDLIKSKNKFPFVRVSSSNIENISRSLDAGSMGLILPMIEDDIYLKNILNNTIYPPYGRRSVGYANSNCFGNNLNSQISSPFKPIIIVQIESEKGVENIEHITDVENIDGILIGPYDLSSSLGCPGDFSNIKYLNAVEKVTNTLKKKSITNGYHIVNPDSKQLVKKKEEGYGFIAYGTESSFMRKFFNF